MNNCLYCGKYVENKYCNTVCQNKHQGPLRKKFIEKICEECGNVYVVPMTKKGIVRKFCSVSCSCKRNKNKIVDTLTKEKISKTLKTKNSTKTYNYNGSLLELTKGELKEKRNTYQSWRSDIRRLSKKLYYSFHQNEKNVCKLCGYDKHVEVCHIKSVSNFSDNAKLSVICNKENMILLCPNCHWELDNGLLNEIISRGELVFQ